MNGALKTDPDEILRSIKEREQKESQGRLKLFFGMCAGVGKTYTMLEAARKAKKEGVDVVIGLLEAHGREETEKLAVGIERIALKRTEYRGAAFSEMDLDAILQRNPSLVLVDELAHTNMPGSRHIKRYQDVLELLSRGIDVYTTMNVQHLESRAGTVRQITGATVRETIPDSILDRADDIELVDITPDELLKRLSEGKVYTTERSAKAMENFFRKGNLTALREMSLRITAERVDWQLRDYMAEKRIAGTWKSGQRLMVAIGPSPYSAEIIRWTRRLAFTMEASWIAVYVETDTDGDREQSPELLKNISLARELGAEIITTADTDIVKGLIRIARENNITNIVIGKSREDTPLGRLLRPGLASRLIKASGDIDIYIAGGPARKTMSLLSQRIILHSGWQKYLLTAVLTLVYSLMLLYCFPGTDYHTISMFLMLMVAILPLLDLGPGPQLLAALLSSLSWDYLFIPPRFTLHIGLFEDILMFILFFIVAIVAGYLSARIRAQERLVRLREERTSALYNLIKQLSRAASLDDVAGTAVLNIRKVFGCETAVLWSDAENGLSAEAHPASTFRLKDNEWRIAQWVFLNGQTAGRYTNTLPMTGVTFYALKGKEKTYGVIGIKAQSEFSFDQQTLFSHFITQITSMAEREYLSSMSRESLILNESEKLYKTLFNSISHEIRTPLTAIMTASSNMADPDIISDKQLMLSFAGELKIAARRLNSIVENLLDMARIEAGVIRIKSDWYYIQDLLSSVMNRLKEESDKNRIEIRIGEETGLLKFDFSLMEQTLVNILRNCLGYSPPESKIWLEVWTEEHYCCIRITDSGPGFPEGTLSRVFEKFYRVPGSKRGGTGLGLSIAKGFMAAHNGSIEVSNRKAGGAEFLIKLPVWK